MPLQYASHLPLHLAMLIMIMRSTAGLSQFCQHNFEHTRMAKALSIYNASIINKISVQSALYTQELTLVECLRF